MNILILGNPEDSHVDGERLAFEANGWICISRSQSSPMFLHFERQSVFPITQQLAKVLMNYKKTVL
jgi:hypothetical protein